MDVIYTYLYCFPPVNITKAISQEDKQESEEKIVQRLQGTTLVVARLPCAHCLAVLSAHFIVVCIFRFWYVPCEMHGAKIYFVFSFAIFL